MVRNRGPQQLRHFAHELREIDRLDDEAACARICQHLARQVRGSLAGLHDVGEQVSETAVLRDDILGQTGVAQYADEKVIKIVRDTARQQADALQLLFLPEFSLQLLALGKID